MYFIYFSWWKDFRVPTSTPKVKVATAGKACGVWYEKLNTFQFKLPAGICAADMTFMGTSGVHDFHFTLDSAKASHVAWEHADYPHTTDAFLLERAFSQVGKRPQVVDLPLPRVAEMTRYHNPTRPAHLKGGALVRRRRSYSPNEFRSVQAMSLEQSPAYLTRKMKPGPRAKSAPHRNYFESREKSREKSPSPYNHRVQRVPPSRRDSRSSSRDRSRSKSPSVYTVPIWVRRMRSMPIEHSKFLWDIVSYITSLQAFFDFAVGCGIPNHMVRKAIEDNDPSDDDISLDNCVVQALTTWWTSNNTPAVKKSERIKQGFVHMNMPGIYTSIIRRHPALDPTPSEPVGHTDPQPGTSGQMSPRPSGYRSLENVASKLLSVEYDFLRDLSHLVETYEHSYGLSFMMDLPDETFRYIRKEHTRCGLSLKEKWSRVAFHLLTIWFMRAKSKNQVISGLKVMFNDMGLMDGCTEVFNNYPNLVKKLTSTENKGPQGVKMGTKSLGKGKNSKTTAIQSNCSSMHPLNPIGENGEESDMEEQMPELLDLSDDEINTSTGENQQGTTTETENNNGNENGNSRHTHTKVLMRNVKNLQK